MDGRLSDSKKISMEYHVIWGCSSAQQLRRVSVYSDGDNAHLAANADEVLEQRGCVAHSIKPRMCPLLEPRLCPCLIGSCE